MEVLINLLAVLLLPIVPLSFLYSMYLKHKEGKFLMIYPALLLLGGFVAASEAVHPSLRIVAFLSSALYALKLLSANSFNTFLRFLFFSLAGAVLGLEIPSVPYALSFILLALVSWRIKEIYGTTSFRITGGLLDIDKPLAYILIFAYTPFIVFYTFTVGELIAPPGKALLFSLVNIFWTAAFGKLFKELIGGRRKGVLR
ncbi:hypothetical protein [Aquifex sp.]